MMVSRDSDMAEGDSPFSRHISPAGLAK